MGRYGPRLLGALLALLLSVSVAGCGGSDQSTGSPAGGSPQTFTYAALTDVMISWDPGTGYSNEYLAMPQMYEGLTRYNVATQQVEPLLAKEFSASADSTEWTFKLRPDVVFHTGRPLTAQAVKAAIERTRKLKQGAYYIWDAVKKIDAPDPLTVVFHLKHPAPLDLISSAGYAAWIYDTEAADGGDLAKWFEEGQDAGTGPYTVEQWKKGQEFELRLKSFPQYWGGWSGTHYKNVVFRVVSQPTTSAQLLRAGEVSFVQLLPANILKSFENDTNFQVASAPAWYNYLLMLNTRKGALKDLRVRQAISFGVDYAGIANASDGSLREASGVVPPGLWGHSDDVPTYTYDPERAASLLEEAGYGPNGKAIKLELTYVQGDAHEELIARIAKSTLAQLNIELNVRPLEWPTLWDKAKSPNPNDAQDITIYAWFPDYPDPYSWFVNMFHTEQPPYFNASYYSNPQVDDMMTQAAELAGTDRALASGLYKSMQEILLHDAPAVFAGDQVNKYAMLKSVRGFVVNPAYNNVAFVYDLTPQK